MSWTAVRVTAGDPAAVAAALFDAGALAVQEDGDALVTHVPPGTDLDRVRALVAAADPAARLHLSVTPDVDWSAAWRDAVRVQQIGDLTVAPPWCATGHDASRTVLIEPGMAFGTGDHPTTRGLLRLLQRAPVTGRTVADLGAGSAVLAIAAAKLGARRAVAVEMDPDALGNARENIARNGVADRVHLVEGDAQVVLPLIAPVDVALANIVSSVLLELLPAAWDAVARGGSVLLGGILAEERTSMADALGAGGWQIRDDDLEDAWWSVAALRP